MSCHVHVLQYITEDVMAQYIPMIDTFLNVTKLCHGSSKQEYRIYTFRVCGLVKKNQGSHNGEGEIRVHIIVKGKTLGLLEL
jgi:hypothetical protein